jgi:hypothetical protein
VSGNSSSLRNSVTFGSLPIFKSGRTEASSVPGPTSGDFSLDNPQDEENARKRVKASRLGDVSLSHNFVGDSAAQPTQLSSTPGVPPKADNSGNAEGFEQEMIAALGLSPTDPRSQRSASTPVATIAHSQMHGGKGQFKELSRESGEPTAGNQSSCEPPTRKPPFADKSLPLVPDEHSDVSAPSVNKQKYWPSNSTPDIVTTSAVPMAVEDAKPPPPPPKDNGNGLAPDEGHKGQHSVSTLGPDEQTGGLSETEDNSDPPSPLRKTSEEVPPENKCKDKDEHLNNGNSIPAGDASSTSLSAVHKKRKSFIPFYPSEPASSTETLESRRKSINGLPPSVPDVQSPLRNEVRYSPGTRSSMLSFGSFGRHSANNKGSRPVTPANDLSQASDAGSPVQMQNESAIGKLKSFGRRRRASVGDLLSSIQGQGSQGQGSHVPAAGQRKRTFNGISVWQSSHNVFLFLFLTQTDTLRPTRVSRS